MNAIQKILTLWTLSLAFSSTLWGQANLLNARVPQEVGQLNEAQLAANDEEPLAYGYIDDRDVLWSKTVWELIDLKERINFPYYYPTDTMNLGTDRRSLFDVLLRDIKKGKIKEIYSDGYFLNKITQDEILDKLVLIDTSDAGYTQMNENGYVDPEFITPYSITSNEIEQYRIKGTWYFNKRLGEMKYRLLAICPLAFDLRSRIKLNQEELVELFWVWFPDARKSLNKSKVFNSKNSSQPITYDAMLNARRFNSIIYKEENIFEDRQVKDYIFEDALRQLLESERIKGIIRDFEQDMWNN
jgi:gliding motility associated protien GldN